MPVEVVLYANFGGPYTMTEPTTLITISSSDYDSQGYAALKSLFHEASHALIDTLERQLDSLLRTAGKIPTFQLIHVIIPLGRRIEAYGLTPEENPPLLKQFWVKCTMILGIRSEPDTSEGCCRQLPVSKPTTVSAVQVPSGANVKDGQSFENRAGQAFSLQTD
jgi:hypothetical protein